MPPEPSAAPRRPSRRPAMQLCSVAEAAMAPAPIDPSWLLGATVPRTRAATLAADRHDTLAVYLWETTRAHYRWQHRSDEVVTVLEGECFVADEDAPGAERRLGSGDVAFFPAGSRSVWRVPGHLRKISTLVRPLPRPIAWSLDRLRRLARRGRGR